MKKAIAKREMDSKEIRTRATYAIGYHEGTKLSAQQMVVNAIACGVQLQRAKATLPHGQYMNWRKNYIGKTISDRTLNYYLKLVDTLALEHKSKYATVADLLDVNPSKVTPAYAGRVLPKVNRLTEGKHYRELLEDFNIIKPRQTKSIKAAKKMPARTGDNETDQKNLGHVWVEDVLALLDGAESFKGHLHDEDLTALLNSFTSTAAVFDVPLVPSPEGGPS